MQFFYTAKFLKSLNKLPKNISEDVYQAVDNFKKKENYQKLKLHKLHGSFKKYYAFSVNYRHRIILKIEDQNIYFMDVGDHSLYEN